MKVLVGLVLFLGRFVLVSFKYIVKKVDFVVFFGIY